MNGMEKRPTAMTGAQAIEATNLAEALAGCARGDKAALKIVYDAEASRMLGIAMRVLRRRELAEEAVHDSLLRIYEHAAQFDPTRGSARAWIFTIVRNRALNIARGETRNDLVDDFEPMNLADESDDPETIVARMSDARSLRRCLEQLAPSRRRLIVLAYAQGLTQGEIAGRLGMPLGTVKSWIRRSLLALRECLE